jgi:sphingomyelin phosphodiesterase 2
MDTTTTTGSLRVVTLNVWGLPDVITKRVKHKDPKWVQGSRRSRIKEIGMRLAPYDLVGLQEVWLSEDREALKEYGLQSNLPYCHSFSSGMLGTSGLMILSRFPILDVHFFRYKLNGQVIRVDHGDFYAGKGVGYAKIQIAEDRVIELFLTHTIAKYTENGNDDHYRADRLTQLYELGRTVQMATSHYDDTFHKNSKVVHNVVVLGDFNCSPENLEYQALLKLLGKSFSDSLVEHTQTYSKQDVSPSYWITHENDGQRLDYVFYKRSCSWKLLSSSITMKHEDGKTLISDHYGVEACFELQPASSVTQNQVEEDTTSDSSFLAQMYHTVDEGLSKVKQRKSSHKHRASLAFVSLTAFVTLCRDWIPLPVVAGLSAYLVIELFIALVVVENEESSLAELKQEMKYLKI